MPSVAISRAVVNWPGSGRPLALRKTVPFMPSCRALAVIMRAKVVSSPPSISPSAVAESFADLVTIDRIAVSTVTEPPGFTPSFVGASAEA